MSTMTKQTHSFSRGQELSTSIGMTMTLVSFAMLFAALFLGYISFRLTSEVWPPVGMGKISLGMPTLSTIVILLSSLTYLLYENTKESKWLGITTILSTCFMVSQLLFWQGLEKSGIFVDTTIFASMIYGFTWIHAAHVVCGFFALAYLMIKERMGLANSLWIKCVGQFWHFLGIIWFVMFIGIFVL